MNSSSVDVRRCALLETLESRTLLAAAAPVFAAHSTIRGQDLGEWAARWVQWAVSIPSSQNPLLDTTGQSAAVNQPKDVFFLAGTNTTATLTRNITVPTGTPLFFPVLNVYWVNNDSSDPPFAPNEADIRGLLDFVVAGYNNTFATVDGVPVSDLAGHVEEDPAGGFPVRVPQDNILGYPADDSAQSATEGIYLMVKPLSPGQHTIHFGGVDPAFEATLDITYNITVVPKGQYDATIATIPSNGASLKSALFSSSRIADDVLN